MTLSPSLIDWSFRVVFDVLDELDLVTDASVPHGGCRLGLREDDDPVVWDEPSAVCVDVRPQLHSDPSRHETEA
jgi:hypothetical protein